MEDTLSEVHASTDHFDALVIGAGITGIYQVYLLEKLGLRVRGVDSAGDVGGTWYWNRYPGCRLDTESFAYGYFATSGIIPDWTWKERFAGQPELLRYVNHAADVMDVRQHYEFGVKVTSATYLEDRQVWQVSYQDGRSVECRYLLSAAGPLSATKMPNIPGIDRFKGDSYHTSRWPSGADGGPATLDFSGKRVGVIGTGATGVQIVPVVAETADQLYVYQRSPNWCTPLGNGPLETAEMESIRSRYETLLEYIKTTPTAFPYNWDRRKAVEVSEDERQSHFENLYKMPGYGIWLGGFKDLLVDRESNKFLADFIADKIRHRVNDPETAEKLIPKDHPFGSKRVPMETEYYETFNQSNVRLVDVSEDPIVEVTETGLRTKTESFDLDVIVYATGFDAVTGALDQINIVGRDGTTLNDYWADGPLTYLGVQARGFPNFFTLVGPHSGASFCNIGVCGALQVEWVARLIHHMENQKILSVEPTERAQEEWTDEVYRDFERTLFASSNAWWIKTVKRPDGTEQRRSLITVNAGAQYRKRCEDIAYHNYSGFEFS